MSDTLRAKVIHLANTRPELREHLLPILKQAARLPAERYEVVESKRWFNKKTNATASLFGAVPWTSPSEKNDWELQTVGWTVRDNDRGTVGIGRQPWKSRSEAQAWVDKEQERMEEIRRRQF